MIHTRRLLIILFVMAVLLGTATTLNAQAGITITTQYQAQLRGGPGTNFPSVGVVPTNTTLPATARSADKQWVQVNFNGTVGWIAVRLVKVNGDLNALPVGTGGQVPQAGPTKQPPSPTPTRTPVKRIFVPQAALNRICVTNQKIDTAPVYDGAPGVHPIVLLKAAGGVHTFNSAVPKPMVSTTQPQLVACISDPVTATIEVCPYRSTTTGATATLTRTVQTVTVRVMVVQTGQVLGTVTLSGPHPGNCQRIEQFPRGGGNMIRAGGPVAAQQVVDWAKQFVNR